MLVYGGSRVCVTGEFFISETVATVFNEGSAYNIRHTVSSDFAESDTPTDTVNGGYQSPVSDFRVSAVLIAFFLFAYPSLGQKN